MSRHRGICPLDIPNVPSVIATFGDSKLVRDMSGRLELKGGNKEDRQQARLWVRMFLTRADDQRSPVVSERYPGHALGRYTPIGH
jgi:hypothetical protein